MLVSSLAFAQPSNDCPENPLVISTCGTAFSVSQATMGTATDGATCAHGIACPQVYVNATVYENFDCNATTNGGSNGDDFVGSVENNLWWSFTPTESCDYTISISATNCCCKDKGSTNAAQFAIFDANAALPGGTIQNYLAANNNFTGTVTTTISVTNGNPVYIMLDGVNGTDCDISVTINPVLAPNPNACAACSIVLPIELLSFDGDKRNDEIMLNWSTATEVNNDFYTIEKSTDGTIFKTIGVVSGAGNSNNVINYQYADYNMFEGTNYYRLRQTDYDGKSKMSNVIAVNNHNHDKEIYKIIDMTGTEINDPENYNGILIYKYTDGSVRKIIKQQY